MAFLPADVMSVQRWEATGHNCSPTIALTNQISETLAENEHSVANYTKYI